MGHRNNLLGLARLVLARRSGMMLWPQAPMDWAHVAFALLVTAVAFACNKHCPDYTIGACGAAAGGALGGRPLGSSAAALSYLALSSRSALRPFLPNDHYALRVAAASSIAGACGGNVWQSAAWPAAGLIWADCYLMMHRRLGVHVLKAGGHGLVTKLRAIPLVVPAIVILWRQDPLSSRPLFEAEMR